MSNTSILTVLEGKLTPEQYRAAIDPAREVLCIACAGSGKSRTLAYRIARLIAQGADPKSILAFTFTEKAAESIKRRVAEALREAGFPVSLIGAMYIGTIHSYCQFLLGEMDAKYRQYEVLDENRLKLYLLSRFYKIHLNTIQAAKNNVGQFTVIGELADAWKTTNDELISLDAITQRDQVLGETLTTLKDNLDDEQYIDFSLMIRLVVEAFNRNDASINSAVSELKHVMVDEYQDVNPAQEQLIRALHSRCETLFVVGDDDQAIYAWRGADVNNILTFGQRYTAASSHTLSENFRSTQPIVECANGFIVSVLSANRLDKSPYAHGYPDGTIRDFRNLWFGTREEEANWVASRINSLLGTKFIERDGTVRGLTKGDFAILMRSTSSGETPRHLEFTNALRALGIDYTIESAGGIFDRPHASVLRDTFELLRNASPSRTTVTDHFNNNILPHFPNADLNRVISVISDWNLQIHTPPGGTRRKVYPQGFLHSLLNAFGLPSTQFNDVVLRDLGVFSNIILDVEKVYVSIDSPGRYREILNFLQNVAESGYDVSTINLITRPDAVMISTVHKMKGLEYPVVFIVDVVNGRFPLSNKSYRGWIPAELITSALSRGAYGTSKYDEARLFYTALTRAERYLYITGGASQPGLKTNKKQSDFSLRLRHQELVNVADGLPENHEVAAPRKRFDETEVPTSYTQIKDYLTCPKKYKFRQHYGFSPPVPEMFGFGLTTHTAIGKLHQQYTAVAPTGEEAEEVAKDVFHLKHAFPSNDPVNRPGGYENAMNRSAEIVRQYVEDFSSDFTRGKQVEARFEIKAAKSVISGAIDLLLTEDPQGNVYAQVIDFKALSTPEEDTSLIWTDLSLQVQLYAHAAHHIFGENANTGAVHFLKENSRVDVPISQPAITAAMANIEWAVERILDDDFPMRPSNNKCDGCDFKLLCAKRTEQFKVMSTPPPIHVPNGQPQMVPAFGDVN